MSNEIVKVPDIGGADDVEIVEVCVSVGDSVDAEDSLIVLETDKATMEVPAPSAGTVAEILVSVGDKVSEGSDIMALATGAATSAAPAEKAPAPTAEPVPAAEPVQAPAVASAVQPIIIPDLGGADDVDVIEVNVAVGDSIEEGDTLIVLETDKASMEVPSPFTGTITNLSVNVGDKVSEGNSIGEMDAAGAAPAPATAPVVESAPEVAPVSEAPATVPAASGGVSIQPVAVPDLGGAEDVDVIEVSVAVGDEVADGDTLIVLETDKASMEIPAPFAGKITAFSIKEGDKVNEGNALCEIETEAVASPGVVEDNKVATEVAAPSAPASAAPAAPSVPSSGSGSVSGVEKKALSGKGSEVYAGPAVRALARELGVELSEVKGSGPKGRIQKDDLHDYVKRRLNEKPKAEVTGGAGIPQVPEIDFSKFGDIDMVKMTKIDKVTAFNMQRSWLNVPHVTQWDDADITDLEEFRKSMKAEAEKMGKKLTPLPFLIKACALALQSNPKFNRSLHADGEHFVQKKYVHIGIAVDTPNGLVVPVLRDADKKSIWQLADESNALAKKARDGKLKPIDMQGASFTISSLGAIGGNGFTPVVNTPEVGILGVSKAQVKPVWNGSEFVPRNMLPLALSYDHRAINGVSAGTFMVEIVNLLSDVRRMVL
ncbi:MAG: 2-oxo acid dehydrogenase subunit E2 [Cellvibrionaceae bacterium]